jgi:hypothetical protein
LEIIVPVVSKLSPVPDESILTASIARELSSVLKISTSTNSFIDKKYVDGRYSLEVCDVNEKFSICCGRGNGGSVEVIGDVYIAARRGGRRFLNVVHCRGSVNTESRSNKTMSIDGGCQSKGKYKGDE